MKIFFSFFLLSLLLQSFNYSKPVNKIIEDYSNKLREEKNLYLDGAGGAMCNDIQYLFASYTGFKAINIEEAENLYVEIVEEYVKRLNQEKSIRPYFHDYPCTYRNVKVWLDFVNENNKFQENGNVALIQLIKNVVYFQGRRDNEFYDLHTENYEELLKKVHRRKN